MSIRVDIAPDDSSSACVEALLRKHGVVPLPSRHTSQATFVIRSASDLRNGQQFDRGLIEGPLSPALARELGIEATPRSSQSPLLSTPSGRWLGPLAYPVFSLRAKKSGGWRGAPYAFEPQGGPWAVHPVEYQRLEAVDPWKPALKAQISDEDPPETVAVSDGRRLVLGIPLLNVLSLLMSPPPFPDGYAGLASARVEAVLEEWLLNTLRQHVVSSELPWYQLLPWPDGRRWAHTIRHDYDRLLTDEQILKLLALYKRHGVRSTWYLLRDRTPSHQASLIAAQGHEVALHTRARSELELLDELRFLRRQTGLQVAGMTAHGGDAVGYLGGYHVAWSVRCGLRYGETIGRESRLPSQALLEQDGRLQPAPLLLLATHRSIDGGMKPEQHHLEKVLIQQARHRQHGGHFLVMNHPDIHHGQMLRVLERAELADAWCATAELVARWISQVQYGARWVSYDGGMTIALRQPVSEAALIELEEPSGVTRRYPIPVVNEPEMEV